MRNGKQTSIARGAPLGMGEGESIKFTYRFSAERGELDGAHGWVVSAHREGDDSYRLGTWFSTRETKAAAIGDAMLMVEDRHEFVKSQLGIRKG